MYELTFSPNNLTPELKRYVGQGCLLALDEGMTVMPQMNCGGLCKVYIGLKCPENGLTRTLCLMKGSGSG